MDRRPDGHRAPVRGRHGDRAAPRRRSTAASLGPPARAGAPRWRSCCRARRRSCETILSPLPPVRGSAAPGRAPAPRRGRAGGGGCSARSRRSAWTSSTATGARRRGCRRRRSTPGLPPSTAVSGAFGLLLQLLGHSHGWPIPRGGAGRSWTPSSRAPCARAHGPLRRARRAHPGPRAGAWPGCACVGGEESRATPWSATVSARALMRMLRARRAARPPAAAAALWRYGTGAFKLDYALSGPAPWTAAEPRATPRSSTWRGSSRS